MPPVRDKPHFLIPVQVPTLLSLVFDTTFLTPSIEYVASTMVSLVRQSFNDTIAQEEWLDAPTILLAQRKLKAALVPCLLPPSVHSFFTLPQVNLGGPNPKESFTEAAKEDFPVVTNFITNLLNAQSNLIHLRIKRLNAPVQRSSWAGCVLRRCYALNGSYRPHARVSRVSGLAAQMLTHFTSAIQTPCSFPAPSCSRRSSALTGSFSAPLFNHPILTSAAPAGPCPAISARSAQLSVMSSRTVSTIKGGCSTSTACIATGGLIMSSEPSWKELSVYLTCTGSLLAAAFRYKC